jgi:hypothetical protein
MLLAHGLVLLERLRMNTRLSPVEVLAEIKQVRVLVTVVVALVGSELEQV